MSEHILIDPDDPTRRWDIEIEDNQIIKMVEKDSKEDMNDEEGS